MSGRKDGYNCSERWLLGNWQKSGEKKKKRDKFGDRKQAVR